MDDGKTIRIYVEKNSLSLSLNYENNKMNLKIDDGRADEFIMKMEGGKLNIYDGDNKPDKNYNEIDKKVDDALRLIKESEDNLTDSQLKWGWRTQILLGIIAFYIMFFWLTVVPHWVYYWGILGAVAYIVFSISYHYQHKELNPIQRLTFTARLIQSPILAGAIYLVLIDLSSTQQLIYNINQTLAVGANITYPNITTTLNPEIKTTPIASDNTLMAVSFLVGFFTETAVGFLRALSKKLLSEQPRT